MEIKVVNKSQSVNMVKELKAEFRNFQKPSLLWFLP